MNSWKSNKILNGKYSSYLNGKYHDFQGLYNSLEEIKKLVEETLEYAESVEEKNKELLDEHWKDKIDIDYKFSPENKEEPVIVLSNGCGTGKLNYSGNNSSRLPEYKKYIIDNFKGTPYENTKIYGSWDDEIYTEYPQIQKRMIVELEKEIKGAKYMLVYSQTPGFVTAKPWEMIILGILPFLHPDYDCHNLLKFPEYLYLKDEKDFLNKINELEKNPQKYKDLMKQLQDMLKPEYFDGSFIVNGIFGNIAKDLGFKYKFKPGVNPILNRYESYKV